MSARTDPSRPRKSSPTANEQTDQDHQIDRQAQDALNDIIAKQVVQSLGTPADLLKVQVRPLGRDCYRVNVFVGKYGGNARIANSFFLTSDDEGKILTASPKIARVY